MKTYKLEQHEELRILRALIEEKNKYNNLLEVAEKEHPQETQLIHHLQNEREKIFALMVKFGYMKTNK